MAKCFRLAVLAFEARRSTSACCDALTGRLPVSAATRQGADLGARLARPPQSAAPWVDRSAAERKPIRFTAPSASPPCAIHRRRPWRLR